MKPKTYQVRVIAGSLRGRILRYPANKALRPTMQRTKTSIFETLKDRLIGCVFVDLFCGAGGIGIEALSRGAGHVHFVDRDPVAIDFLKQNLETCRVPAGTCDIHPIAAADFLSEAGVVASRPDIVYIDPPYDSGEMPVLLEFFDKIAYSNLLLVVEHERDVALDPYRRLERVKQKKFGQTSISFITAEGG